MGTWLICFATVIGFNIVWLIQLDGDKEDYFSLFKISTMKELYEDREWFLLVGMPVIWLYNLWGIFCLIMFIREII